MNCEYEGWSGEPNRRCPEICPHEAEECFGCGEIFYDDQINKQGLCEACEED